MKNKILGVLLLTGLCLFIFYSSHSDMQTLTDINNPKEKPFVIVIPSYNNKEWCTRNLESVFSQEYSNFRLIYIDDASSDSTYDLVKEYTEKSGQIERVTLIHNKTRLGALANYYHAIWSCDPREIIVELDGDDWLANSQVLATLNKAYQNPDVWVTYGQFIVYPEGGIGWVSEVPQNIVSRNAFREYRWLTTHLRTYYAALFQKIEKQDFLLDGEFFSMAGDLARMFPIIEMAGRHSHCISDILYVYNIATSINDHVKDPVKQERIGVIIRGKKRYHPIDKLW